MRTGSRLRMRSLIVMGLAMLSCTSPVQGQGERTDSVAPAQLNDGWETAAPAAVGLDASMLGAMTVAIDSGAFGNMHVVLIERAGTLAYEQYFSGDDDSWGQHLGEIVFTPETRHGLRSVSKTVTSLLIGIAIDTGHIDSVGVPLSYLLPGYAHLLEGRKEGITLAHALTMSAGLEWDESLPYSDPRNDERRLTASADPTAYVLERPLVAEPGTTWQYNGGLTHLLAVVVEEATGTQIEEYADSVLFEPLGISGFQWQGDLNGMPAAASGLRLTARDLAKIGSLFLHEGRWDGTQIVSADWVRDSMQSHISVDTSQDPGFVASGGYGYQMWINELRTQRGVIELVAAVGNGGQRIMLVPQFGLAVTVYSGFYDDPNHFWTPEILLTEHIIPAVTDSE